MNKRMRELLTQIEEKTNQVKNFTKNKDFENAQKILSEIDTLKQEYEIEKQLFENEKQNGSPKENQMSDNITKNFAKAIKQIKNKDFSGLQESLDKDGGYIVPTDIQTKINYYRDSQFSFLNLISKEIVKTNKGKRTYQKKTTLSGFSKISEGDNIPKLNGLNFEVVTYDIQDYAGFLPVTNDLINDTDANLTECIIKWLGDNERTTINNEVIELIKTLSPVTISHLDGIKHSINVTLGATYKDTSSIIVNDDGLNWLDTLKDSDGNYFLGHNPVEPKQMQLSVGASLIPVYNVPNSVMPSVEDKYPIVIGDLQEAIKYWDRQQISIDVSDVASIGDVNAFSQNLTLFRGLLRADFTLKDKNAIVYGYINPLGE